MPGNVLSTLHVVIHLVPQELCVVGTIIILILQVRKLGQREVEKFVQASGKPGGRLQSLCSVVQPHVILPLSICISPNLLTQNLLKCLGTYILILVNAPC